MTPEYIWEDHDSRCPSQSYCFVERDGVPCCLYLRWRWDDPWQLHIIRNIPDKLHVHEGDWSDDFAGDRPGEPLYFEYEQAEEAKAALIKIWEAAQ